MASWVFELQDLPFRKSLILRSNGDQEYKFTFRFLIMIAILKESSKIRKFLGFTLIIIIVVSSSITTIHAQSNELLQSRIRLFEAWLNTLMSDQALVGISVSLVQNQKIIYAKGFGVSDFEKESPAT
ncbi:MAG: hypothetical protein VW701_16440, partial [Deltaproteobacteria bacterium]